MLNHDIYIYISLSIYLYLYKPFPLLSLWPFLRPLMGFTGHWLFSKPLFAATIFLPSCMGFLEAPPLALFQSIRENATSTWLFPKPQAVFKLKMAADISKNIPQKTVRIGSPNSVSTLKSSYGRCKGRCLIRVLTLVSRLFPLNVRVKWLMWHVEVNFDCAGSHQVWS